MIAKSEEFSQDHENSNCRKKLLYTFTPRAIDDAVQ